MQMIESIKMALPGHPQILSHLEYAAPQTSNYDVCATRLLRSGEGGPRRRPDEGLLADLCARPAGARVTPHPSRLDRVKASTAVNPLPRERANHLDAPPSPTLLLLF